MATTVLDRRTDDSRVATYAVFLLLTLFFRPSMLYVLSEPIFAFIVVLISGYFFVGKKGYVTWRKVSFLGLCTIFYVYKAVQGISFGTGSPIVVLNEMGFMLAPTISMFMLNCRTWDSAVLALITPVIFFIPSYLLTGLLTMLLGGVDTLILDHFTLDMGDGTYEARWAFPYSLYIGGSPTVGPFSFGRATGFVREPGIYQVLLIISYFSVDIIDLRYKNLFKGGVLVNIFLTFSTAGWGSFAAAWLYYNVFSSSDKILSGVRSFSRRIGALLLSLPLLYYVLYAETKASVTQKLSGSSGETRILLALDAIQEFMSSPVWGVGFQSPEVESIHFVGVVAELGLVGVLLIFLFTFVPIWPLVRKFHPVLVFLVPLILTMLFAQPLFGKTLFFLVLAIVVAYPASERKLPAHFSENPA